MHESVWHLKLQLEMNSLSIGLRQSSCRFASLFALLRNSSCFCCQASCQLWTGQQWQRQFNWLLNLHVACKQCTQLHTNASLQQMHQLKTCGYSSPKSNMCRKAQWWPGLNKIMAARAHVHFSMCHDVLERSSGPDRLPSGMACWTATTEESCSLLGCSLCCSNSWLKTVPPRPAE
jgi:hypothetical protein